MMDVKTFETFQEFVVADVTTMNEAFLRLTHEEQNLYNHLALHQKRLEQERISQIYANQFLDSLVIS